MRRYTHTQNYKYIAYPDNDVGFDFFYVAAFFLLDALEQSA